MTSNKLEKVLHLVGWFSWTLLKVCTMVRRCSIIAGEFSLTNMYRRARAHTRTRAHTHAHTHTHTHARTMFRWKPIPTSCRRKKGIFSL